MSLRTADISFAGVGKGIGIGVERSRVMVVMIAVRSLHKTSHWCSTQLPATDALPGSYITLTHIWNESPQWSSIYGSAETLNWTYASLQWRCTCKAIWTKKYMWCYQKWCESSWSMSPLTVKGKEATVPVVSMTEDSQLRKERYRELLWQSLPQQHPIAPKINSLDIKSWKRTLKDWDKDTEVYLCYYQKWTQTGLLLFFIFFFFFFIWGLIG